MNHLKIIRSYLREKGSLEAVPATGFPFVTISRDAAAGGHLLAHVLVSDFLKEEDQELFGGWHVFDRELCEIVASDPELRTSMENLLTEDYHSEFKEFIDGLFTGRAQQYMQHKKTFRIVRILALLGKVIIVGRAGSLVTRDLASGIQIRLVARETCRARWMMAKLRLTRDEARETIRKQDSDRRKMVRTFFNRDINDPLLYDVVWNSETVEPHEMACSIIQMIKRRYATLPKAKEPAV